MVKCSVSRPKSIKGEHSIKLFTKEVKKVVVDNSLFHCVIDQTDNRNSIRFTLYPARTKTSYVLISFSWAISWYANFCTPRTCAKIVKYALQNGWDYQNEKQVLAIENGDFLVEKLGLEV